MINKDIIAYFERYIEISASISTGTSFYEAEDDLEKLNLDFKEKVPKSVIKNKLAIKRSDIEEWIGSIC